MRLTLRARLAVWAALATGLAVALVAAGLFWSVNGFLRQAQEARLLSVVGAVQGRVEGLLRPGRDDLVGALLGVATVSQRDLERVAGAVDRRGVDLRVVAARGAELVSVGTASFPAGVPLTLRAGPGGYLSADGAHLILVRPLRGTPRCRWRWTPARWPRRGRPSCGRWCGCCRWRCCSRCWSGGSWRAGCCGRCGPWRTRRGRWGGRRPARAAARRG
ncbi:hypothetical protein ACFQDE_10980 [Deinococcus caeni]|uniref:hypothetical protein n=1 Tax=Deinococcus caeni TaxID=569127 RepID=UPI0036220F41